MAVYRVGRAFLKCMCYVHKPMDNTTDNNVFSSVDVLVIGAGPTGLGAAKRLNQLVSCQLASALFNWLMLL